MAGRIDLEGDGRALRITFPFDRELVARVKALPGRTWDATAKVWRVPVAHASAAARDLGPLGFLLSPEVEALLDGQPPPEQPPPAAAAAASIPLPEGTLTVSALNREVAQVLAGAFPASLWVAGEIQTYDRNLHRAHRFFELVEKDEGAGQRARVAAVLFAGAAERVDRKLASCAEPFALRDGLQVRVLARVELYEPRGEYQLVVEDVDEAFTLGRLAIQRQEILRELERLGLREANAALPWPELPLRVGLLTSEDSDACNDFLNELRRSGFAFEVLLCPVAVQGASLEPTVLHALSALERLAEAGTAADVVCIVRGGGSRTDLAWFDNLAVALAVARCPLKVVCGIGHHRDQSVLDLIAHGEKTPTAAAAALVERVRRAEARAEEAFGGALRAAAAAVEAEKEREAVRLARFARSPAAALAGAHSDLTGFGRALRSRAEALLQGGWGLVEGSATRLPVLARNLLSRWEERLEGREGRLRALDPVHILRRGFAILRDASDNILTSAARARPGEVVEARLRDGSLAARVEKVELDKPDP